SHTTQIELPLVDPITTAHGVTTRRASALVGVRSDDHVGWGDASPLPGWSTESLDECVAAIATSPVRDMPAAAAAAVLGANDDLAAREASLPLFAFLAQRRKKNVPIRPEIEINGLISAPDPEIVAAEATALVRLGYSTIKLKVAAGADDHARVSALRDAAPDVVLRLDANGGWDTAAAIAELTALADFNISLCEEPVSGVAAIADLGSEVGIPLAVDESMRDGEGLAQVVHRAVDLGGVVLKPQAFGGPGAAFFAIDALQIAGLSIIITSMIDNAVGLAHAAHIAAAAQLPGAHGLGTARLLARDVAPAHEALPIVNGRMRFAALDDPERWGYGLGLGLVSPGPVGAS
ncbi:MAG: o-succinylbenzoate synthase, partial [Candidatus Aldehydirespiratoraceae bacterium]